MASVVVAPVAVSQSPRWCLTVLRSKSAKGLLNLMRAKRKNGIRSVSQSSHKKTHAIFVFVCETHRCERRFLFGDI